MFDAIDDALIHFFFFSREKGLNDWSDSLFGNGVEIDRDVDGCKRRLGGSKGALKFGEWGWFYRAMKRGRDWVYGLIWVLRLSD